MTTELDLIKGKKTYLLSIAALVYAISAYFTGHVDLQTMYQMVWSALTAAALRHGISTAKVL